MTTVEQTILRDILERNTLTGGSGRGMSFWRNAAACGMRALLTEKDKIATQLYLKDPQNHPAPQKTQVDPFNKDSLRVGSAYHTFQELWRTGGLEDTTLSFNEPLNDVSFDEAARLFRGYCQYWHKNFWGEVTAVEAQLPRSYDAHAQVADIYDTDVTGKPDMVVHIIEEDLPRVQQRCPAVTQPGYYLVDFKTEDVPSSDGKYKAGEQALLYPHMWDIEHPDKPVEGTIFDIIYKHGRRKLDRSIRPTDFHAVFAAKTDWEQLGAITGMIRQGIDNMNRARDTGMGNRAECWKYQFGSAKACRYYAKQCQNEFISLTDAQGVG